MEVLHNKGVKPNIVLTSPPYNTARLGTNERAIKNYENRYDIHLDNKTDDEYIDWTIKLFNAYDKILAKDGCILYNISYSSENTHLLWLVVADIIRKTNFIVADDIIWKKKSALPNNVSSNKLTRIVEHVFVFCRKDEFKTFNCNKTVKSQSKTGQKYYENVFNFIEAKNNDWSCDLNKATYSTELCEQLLSIYAQPKALVLDTFMGTGTTAMACKNMNLKCIGTELSEAQCEFAKERLNKA
jgi:DNA modification methylase